MPRCLVGVFFNKLLRMKALFRPLALGFSLLMLIGACTEQAVEENPSPKPQSLFSVPSNFPAPTYDLAKNPVTEAGFVLGRTLFYDGILSRDGTISCGECHRQEYAFTHHQHDISHGIEDRIGERNAPAVQNMAWMKEFFWDGGVHDLDLFSIAPIENPVEMDEKLGNVLAKLRKSEKYPPLFEKAFGSADITTERFLKSLSQFMLALTSANSKYDRYVRKEAGGELSTDELEGLTIFKQKCASCHAGELFTDQSYRNNGMVLETQRQVFIQESNKIIIKTLKDEGRYRITQNPADLYKFKVPSLRNVAVTRPYMHDGRFWTLDEVLNHYAEGMVNNGYVDPAFGQGSGKLGIALTNDEKTKLKAFLNTLTDRSFLANPKFSEQ